MGSQKEAALSEKSELSVVLWIEVGSESQQDFESRSLGEILLMFACVFFPDI